MKGLGTPICGQCPGRLIRAKIRGMVFILFLLLGLTMAHSGTIEVSDIEVEGEPGERIVTLRFTEPVNYHSFTLGNPPRLVLDIPGATLKEPRTIEVRNEVVETISYRQHQPDTVRIVVDLTRPAESRVRKVGRELRLHLSLPREVRVRLRAEERARQLFAQRMKRKTELKAREVAAEKERALGIARREARERERQLETYLSRGERHFRAQRFEEARGKFEAALALDPGNEKAQHYLILIGEGKEARILAKEAMAREEKARQEEEQRRQEIRRLEEEREQRIAEHLNRGREYYLRGRYEEAISEGERVLALSPGNRRAEDLIRQSRRQALERDKRRAREEREMVEARRILDVTRASFVSPVDYTDAIDPERRMIAREEDAAIPEEEEAVGLREKAAETMVSMNFRDADIVDVLFFLSEMSGITIAVDERALDELVDPGVSIFTPTEIPLTDALDIILRVKGLEHVIREHYIWVAEVGRVEEPVVRVHRLRHGIRQIRAVAPVLPEEEEF